ncbi:MAG: hypothetical protein QXY87_07650 [Saccharolobus sp.]|uniref:hypothetical protein n=1 Tax=Saccharolobus TaxID=2100760 RepID=UPI001F0E3D63|nr:hypothetical protein [Saccharolobus shibatae]MCH4816244.1 hypothetical protein [Saccharolobus shibatae]
MGEGIWNIEKLITTPLPRYSIVIGRSLASGVRSLGNPLTYIIDICRRLMITGNTDSILGDLIAILIFNMSMYFLASIRFKKIIE